MISENGTKICSKCKIEKPVSEFHKDKNSSDGYTYACKDCRNAKYKEYYYANPEKIKEKVRINREYRKEYYDDPERKLKYRKRFIERKFNISYEVYDQLMHEQNGVCAICGNEETSSNAKYLAVDHDHNTGKIRGLLCSKCNRAIGLLQDNPDIVNEALNYLKKHKHEH